MSQIKVEIESSVIRDLQKLARMQHHAIPLDRELNPEIDMSTKTEAYDAGVNDGRIEQARMILINLGLGW